MRLTITSAAGAVLLGALAACFVLNKDSILTSTAEKNGSLRRLIGSQAFGNSLVTSMRSIRKLPVVACDASIDPSKVYHIVARHSGKVLAVQGSSTSNKAFIVQKALDPDGTADDWSFEPRSTVGFFNVINANSDLAINVAGNSNDDTANIIQWPRQPASDSVNDEWCFQPVGDDSGYYFVVAHHSGKLIDISGNSQADNANAIQYGQHGGQNQQFKLVEVESSSSSCTDAYDLLVAEFEAYKKSHEKCNIGLEESDCTPTAAPVCTSSNNGTHFINACEEKCICELTENGYEYVCYREREEITCMSVERRQRYLDAYQAATTPGNALYADMVSLLEMHKAAFASGNVHNVNEYFLPWHRWYALAVEDVLRREDCRITLPWWKWTKKSAAWSSNSPFLPSNNWYGEDGTGTGQCVATGPFTSTAIPSWVVPPGATCLRRRFRSSSMPSIGDVLAALNPAQSFASFSRNLELNIHNSPHCNIGGTMCSSDSSKAPEFFLHHGYIDEIWDTWQTIPTVPPNSYQLSFPSVILNDPMPNTIAGPTPNYNSVGYHLDLKTSGVTYVKTSSVESSPGDLTPQCRLIATVDSFTSASTTAETTAATVTFLPPTSEPAFAPTTTFSPTTQHTPVFAPTLHSTSPETPKPATPSLAPSSRPGGGVEPFPPAGTIMGIVSEDPVPDEPIVFLDLDEIEEAFIREAANDTDVLSTLPQRPIEIKTIEEMKGDFFFIVGKASGLSDEVLEQQLEEIRDEQIASNAALQFPTDEFRDDASDLLGFDVRTALEKLQVCPVGSTRDPESGTCNDISQEAQAFIDETLQNSTVVLGEIVSNEDLETTPAPVTVAASITPSFAPADGVITGTVSEDTDNDGDGDEPIAGVQMILLDTTGNGFASTVTDENGYYEWSGLPTQIYFVQETNLQGFDDVSDADGGDPNEIVVSVDGGISIANDFVDSRQP